MASNYSFSILTYFIIFSLVAPSTLAQKKGFTTDLIHRESPLLSLKTPSLNQYERLRNSIQRSLLKIPQYRTSSSLGDVQSKVKSAQGEYLMEMSLGTPPKSQLGIIDTGSDLIWAQCKPCLKCFKQELPIFDPRKSSSYRVQTCHSRGCKALHTSESTCSKSNRCGYTYHYGDKSYTSGALASDTITFKSIDNSNGTSFPKIIFGCGHKNDILFQNSDVSSIVGLGAGRLSLASQLNSWINGKFSYCLIPFSMEGNYTSKINFGTSADVSGVGVISTPITHDESLTYHYLNLKWLSVGKTKISFKSNYSFHDDHGTSISHGNIIIDSGTTLTFLPSHVYINLISALQHVIKGKRVKDPTGVLPFCYKTKNGGMDLNIPNVTAHFAGCNHTTGGDMVLKPSNTFVQVADEVLCLAIVPVSDQSLSILGNLAQINFLIGYDTINGKLSLKPMDCTKKQL